jgi:peptidoglycan L-alanyl-D-glutamate endopeptidase CwlK
MGRLQASLTAVWPLDGAIEAKCLQIHSVKQEVIMSAILQLNSSGPDVATLQRALLAAGFSPGVIDGSFGTGTEAAVLAFQRSTGIAADGVVGPNTATALGLLVIPSVPSAIAGVTVQVVSQMFPATPIGNIKTNLPPVLDALVSAKLPDRAMVLMALGTIRAETESFQPISEGQSRFNTSPSGTPFDLYDNRRDLGNTGPPDGASFRGRGFVQLTGRANYTHFAGEIDLDLVTNPELANDPLVAAKLLARFLGDREDRIREALTTNDLATARRLVNGGSNGLDRFTDAFNRGMQLIPV